MVKGGWRKTSDFPSTAYQTLQGFPFRPAGGILQSSGNVRRKFKSIEINSEPRGNCAAFTRLEYLASKGIPPFIKAFTSLNVNPAMSC